MNRLAGDAAGLRIADLRAAYMDGRETPRTVMTRVLSRIAARGEDGVWITRASDESLYAQAEVCARLLADDPDILSRKPLLGAPFAVKDNIDVAGLPTTAACPDFLYRPKDNAAAVQRLLDAGAICVGKTNLDQFATGLVGTRSPYGVPRNAYHPDYIPGGSSSGSAVAVAAGLVAFALGTDTAGSGRIPAAFNNIVGLKPTCGALSTRGVVPACRSLDCISIFAADVDDAMSVLEIAAAFDPADPFSRSRMPAQSPPAQFPSTQSLAMRAFRFAVPRDKDLEFFGNTENARLFQDSVARFQAMGGTKVTIDLTPFLEAGALLYDGPWVAERDAAVGTFIQAHRDGCDPTVADIILAGRAKSATQVFEGMYRLQALKRETGSMWADVDCLLVPTAPTIYTVAEIAADPVKLNTTLGTYTRFMNLLDLAGISIPAGFSAAGLPFGVTLVGPAFSEARLAVIARLATGAGHPDSDPGSDTPVSAARIEIAVVGAHMSGLPLNHELTSRGAHLVESTRTAQVYRFYALAGGPPFRPGLVRAKDGQSIAAEVWSLPATEIGGFLAGIPAPLVIGTVELHGGRKVKGFLCETAGLEGASDITSHGGWRSFLASRKS